MKLSEIEWNPVGLTVADEAESDRGEFAGAPGYFSDRDAGGDGRAGLSGENRSPRMRLWPF